ncbi:FtsQ-type POTRA domain-containing protein [Oceanispirochaeta crateris]|uniref:FtsQ-type POTRA domain-containing protein n=1 Tax=Oceanispirochaeta crateris TaxID=2518645 RepID=A0A5C1QMX4_9SPIO|nr:FtsQ-type POTRA domain-containing protein [Oceanispirochaeta crateris]QEN07904.1 FtsQ-type POTRA domain-containing protein [Oceanispirochaeta crateris]
MVKFAELPVVLKLRRVLFIFIMLLLLLLGIQLCLTYLILPRMQIGQILLESTLDLSDEVLLSMGGLTGRENYISLNESEIRENFESFPMIRKAYVEKQFPRTLKIILFGRSPLGLAFAGTPGESEPLAFDEYGVVFEVPGNSGYMDLPVLTGLSLEDRNGTQRLPDSLSPLLRDLMNLKKNSPHLFGQISEISVRNNQGVFNEIRLYVNSYKLPILLSAALSDTVMKKILLVLDSLSSGSLMKNLEYADFRTEQVVLKTREGN